MSDHLSNHSPESGPAVVLFEEGAAELDRFFDDPENNMMLYGGPTIQMDWKRFKPKTIAAITYDFHLADV
jgi:hypothetical protein